ALGAWVGISSNAVLSGSPQLSLQFSAAGPRQPLQQIDLFVDGRYFKALTNQVPAAGNVLTVSLNGYPISYTVPTNGTIATVAAGMAAVLNAAANTNTTKTVAILHGHRVELQSTSTNRAADPFYFVDNESANGPARTYRLS